MDCRSVFGRRLASWLRLVSGTWGRTKWNPHESTHHPQPQSLSPPRDQSSHLGCPVKPAGAKTGAQTSTLGSLPHRIKSAFDTPGGISQEETQGQGRLYFVGRTSSQKERANDQENWCRVRTYRDKTRRNKRSRRVHGVSSRNLSNQMHSLCNMRQWGGQSRGQDWCGGVCY